MTSADLHANREAFQAAYTTAAGAVCAAHREEDQAGLAEAAKALSALVDKHDNHIVRQLVSRMGDLGPALNNWANIPGKVTPRLARLAHLAEVALADAFAEYLKPGPDEVPDTGPVPSAEVDVCRAALRYGHVLRLCPNDSVGIGVALRRLLAVSPAPPR
jgi:hypothetical protein